MKFVIEHLEPEVYEWCVLEYTHMSSWVGKDNLLITNTDDKKLSKIAQTNKKSVVDLKLKNACILDPHAEKTLTPKDKYEFYIFGGILGDDPPQKRTTPLTEQLKELPRFNLGQQQMSTDTAVIVTKKIIDGTPINKLQFQDGIDIDTAPEESCHLPYRYLIIEGKPIIPPGLIELLKKEGTEEF